MAAREKLRGMRGELGRTGPFPVYAQVEPPETDEAARQMAKSYRDAGIDGIILSERLARENAFPAHDVAAVLLEAAHA
jgi:hypothetical protein